MGYYFCFEINHFSLESFSKMHTSILNSMKVDWYWTKTKRAETLWSRLTFFSFSFLFCFFLEDIITPWCCFTVFCPYRFAVRETRLTVGNQRPHGRETSWAAQTAQSWSHLAMARWNLGPVTSGETMAGLWHVTETQFQSGCFVFSQTLRHAGGSFACCVIKSGFLKI